MKKPLTILMLGAVSVPMLAALGCSTGGDKPPYSLTGKSDEQAAQDHEAWRQRMMYTDEKGHYHPELANQGRPIRPMPN